MKVSAVSRISPATASVNDAYISIRGASEIAIPLRHVKLKESVVNKVLIFSTGAKGGVGKSTVAILMHTYKVNMS